MCTVFVWVNSRWVRFSILDLLGARVELKEVISHRQLMTKLSDLAKVQEANITWAQQIVQAPHWWHDTDCVCQCDCVWWGWFIPLPLQFQAVHPAFHCVPSVLGSASEGTDQSALLTRDPALSAVTRKYTLMFFQFFLFFFTLLARKTQLQLCFFFLTKFNWLCSDGTDRNKHAETCDKQRWSVRQLILILYNPVHLLCVSLLPPPAGGWLPWCHDTSWWPGPLCLSTALWERERDLMNGLHTNDTVTTQPYWLFMMRLSWGCGQ